MPRRRLVLVHRSRQTVAPHGTRYARCHGAALPFEDVGKRSTEAMAGESLAPDPSGEQQALAAWHLIHISHQVLSLWRTWFQKATIDASIDVVIGGAGPANPFHACVDGRFCSDFDFSRLSMLSEIPCGWHGLSELLSIATMVREFGSCRHRDAYYV